MRRTTARTVLPKPPRQAPRTPPPSSTLPDGGTGQLLPRLVRCVGAVADHVADMAGVVHVVIEVAGELRLAVRVGVVRTHLLTSDLDALRVGVLDLLDVGAV